jgi:peptidoglycan-associated lipoprotein
MIRTHRALALTTMLAAMVVVGCKKKPDTAPAPVQQASNTPTETCDAACRQRRADSIAADAAARAAKAREDSLNALRSGTERAKAALATKIFFEYDQADLSEEARTVLDAKVALLRKNPGIRLMISGHADERGSDDYNIALGQRRAAVAKRYLTDQGIDPSRIQITSYGEERPAVTGASEESFRQNRRDEFEMLPGGPDHIVPTG